MNLLIKFPTRSRPDKFCSVLKIYQKYLSGKHDVKFIVSLDKDDETMNNEKIRNFLNSFNNVQYFYGNSKSKIEAVNANMENVNDFDVLFLASDDMVPKIKSYDDVVCSDMQKFWPKTNGALHYNDGRRGRELCTLSIMGRELYKHFGYIYHPDYKSLWCDNEFSDVCRKMNKIVYIDKIICKHEWTGANSDPLYRRNENYYGKDRTTYLRRKSKGFPRRSIF